jgi:hypothetical protein
VANSIPWNFFGKVRNRTMARKHYISIHPFERYRLARIWAILQEAENPEVELYQNQRTVR